MKNKITTTLLKVVCIQVLICLSLDARAQAKVGKHFDRVITLVFENTNYDEAMQQPFFKQVADHGAHFSNFLALTHPSQGNYIALTSGDLNGVVNDNLHDVAAKNIIDLLEAKGLTWKIYAENYPGHCFTGKVSGSYLRKHNPFISYTDIQQNAARCANIVEASQFDQDAANGTLPNYVFFVPNINDDGHNTDVAYADKWYSQKFGKYLADPSFMENTIVITTFDESESGPVNQIYTTISGPAVQPGVYSEQLVEPSLLGMIEDNWSLGNLGKLDASTAPMPNIWK